MVSRRTAVVFLASLLAASISQATFIRSAQPFVGVTHWQYIQQLNEPSTPAFAREVVVNLLEIDTAAPGVRFLMQGGNGAAPGEVERKTTRTFVNQSGAQMGINAGFFDTAPPYPYPNTDLNHVAASNGDVYSTAQGGEPTFNIDANNLPTIRAAGPAGSSTLNNGTPLYNATGGNQRILNGGVVSAPNDSYTTTLNPHTAIGYSQDRTRVFLVTVDGRQTDYSEGMRTDELAQIMLQFGVWNAINLDGGGSTTMVMDDSNDGSQNARVINSPSDNSSTTQAGSERVVANSFAVFATPRVGYVPLPIPTRPSVTGVKELITVPTIFDSFEGSKGRFASAPNASGSSQHVAAASNTVLDSTHAQAGSSSLKLNIVNSGGTPERMQLRFLSGGGSPANNLVNDRAMGNGGFVGTFLRTEAGGDPLWISILIDDGTTTSNGLERGEFFQIIPDGEWHLYQWDLSEDGNWANFSGGNGVINGPNAFIDSLYFSSAAATSGGTNFSGSMWIDTVAYNPNGRLDYLIPEPTSFAVLVCGATMLARRRVLQ